MRLVPTLHTQVVDGAQQSGISVNAFASMILALGLRAWERPNPHPAVLPPPGDLNPYTQPYTVTWSYNPSTTVRLDAFSPPLTVEVTPEKMTDFEQETEHHEPDEPVEDVLAAYEAGEKGETEFTGLNAKIGDAALDMGSDPDPDASHGERVDEPGKRHWHMIKERKREHAVRTWFDKGTEYGEFTCSCGKLVTRTVA